MVESSSGIPPSSGSPQSSSSPRSDMSKQVETGLGKSYEIKGDSAIKKWAEQHFSGMSDKQLDTFVQQFMMTICHQISQQISRELAKARKLAKKLKRAEEGE